MARQARTRAWWVIGAIGAFVVTGCTQAGEPTPMNSSAVGAQRSTAPGPTPTSVPTFTSQIPPTSGSSGTSSGAMPTTARIDSADGAVEFVKFLMREINRAHRVPEEGIVSPYFTEGCLGCRDIVTGIQRLKERGQRASDDIWTIISATPSTWQEGSATVILSLRQARVDLVDELGRKVDYSQEANLRFFLTLSFSGEWRIARWQQT